MNEAPDTIDQRPWLIATDLDGTLLDDSYPKQEAAQAIDKIQRANPEVDVVLVSSKTLAEMAAIAELTERKPYLIFENGGGVAWPAGRFVSGGERRVADYEVVILGASYQTIVAALQQLRGMGFEFTGFADMSPREIADLTNLSLSNARLASQRICSEPLSWQGQAERLQVFGAALERLGFTLQRGGRFYHVTSGNDKIKALDFLRDKIRYETGTLMRLLACGDAPNDLAMLDKADHALVFPDRSGGYLREVQAHVSHAPAAGPETWLTGVSELVDSAAPHTE